MAPKPPPTLTSPQLLTALSHRTRGALLEILSERTETPKNLAQALGRPIRHVEYHLGILEGLGCVELARTERSPGGRVIAHHYRAHSRIWFDRDAWMATDRIKQAPITMDILRLMSEDLTSALLGDTIDEGGNHISRTPTILDEPGYEDLIELLNETLERIIGIQAESSDRLKDGGRAIVTKVHLVQFISPGSDDPNEPLSD